MTTERPASLSILLVEESAACRILAEAVLRQAGHTVHRVGDGDAAFEAVTAGGYDLVLLGELLPLVDGCQAALRIRDWEALHGGHVPIIVVAGCQTAAGRERALAAGVDRYLAKPFRPAGLLAAVEVLMAGRRPPSGREAGGWLRQGREKEPRDR